MLTPWRENPLAAYDAWRTGMKVAGRSYAPNSVQTYRLMLEVFLHWLSERGHDLFSLNGDLVGEFLDSLPGRHGRATARTWRTHLAEISRVTQYLTLLGAYEVDPCLDLRQRARMTMELKPRNIYMPAHAFAVYDTYLDEVQALDVTALDPKEIRAHCMNLLMLHAGLTLTEVQRISLNNVLPAWTLISTLWKQCSMWAWPDHVWPVYDPNADCLQPDWLESVGNGGYLSLDVQASTKKDIRFRLPDELLQGIEIEAPGYRSIQARKLRLPVFVIHWVMAWLWERRRWKVLSVAQYGNVKNLPLVDYREAVSSSEELSLIQSRLFVALSMRDSRMHSKRYLGRTGLASNLVKPSTIYNSASMVFRDLDKRLPDMHIEGAFDQYRGPMTLRNLCMANLIRNGVPDDEVVHCMGLVGSAQIAEMRKVLQAIEAVDYAG